MDLAQMTTFARVVEAGSLSSAARTMKRSLAAVSRQLSGLEKDLGAPLLLRTTRRIALTDAGRRFYEHCLRILREVEEARTNVASANSVTGVVVVSASVTFGLEQVAPYLPELQAKYPALRVDLLLEDRVLDLVGEGIDVAIRVGIAPPDADSMIARKLCAWTSVAVAAPSYVQRRGEPKHPSELAGHAALIKLPGSGPLAPWRFKRGAEEISVDVHGPVRTNALLALRDAAIHGMGIALLPEWLVRDAVARGALKIVLPAYSTAESIAYAVQRVELRSAARIRVLVDHLRKAYAAAGLS